MLPIIFKPKYDYELIRLGSSHDGGYLIEKSSLFRTNFLFSFGVSTNWDFEKDFLKYRKINLMAFDGSIDDFFWENEKKIALKKLKKFSFVYLFKMTYTMYKFKNFFNVNNFQPKFISLSMENSITFEEAIKYSNFKENFFKIDIEGSEYEILDSILNYQNNISGMAIEFHDCNKQINKIINFIRKLKLEIVHIHANNYDDLKGTDLPKTLEISFAKEPLIKGEFKGLPHRLDKPNRSKSPEIKLSFNEE